ncbi:MAG TPA: anthranilate phosphoribosyltransferase [Verrucomicrobiae bacterium]
MLENLTQQLAARQSLSIEQVRLAVGQLTDEKNPAPAKADFLIALAQKGESADEIAAFAAALREKSILPPIEKNWRESREILDIVGTGGDRLGSLGTFNISTTSAIVCAAAGVAVAKHGNRAVTSKSGSADVLEALGIRIDLTPEEAARSLRERNFAFFFAPNFHPAFKNIAPARKLCAERGQRTIFNFLGPLLNPACPSAMLVGVPRAELCEPFARVLQSLGVRRGMVVTGKIGNRQSAISHSNDELSALGENTIAEFYHAHGFTTSVLSLEDFPLQPGTLADLRGGDKFQNAEITRRILRGEERGPKRDAVLLNAGAALFVAGKAKSLTEGWELAVKTIDSGQADAKLAELTR